MIENFVGEVFKNVGKLVVYCLVECLLCRKRKIAAYIKFVGFVLQCVFKNKMHANGQLVLIGLPA